MKKLTSIIIILIISCGSLLAQDVKELTLNQVLEIATKQSLDAFRNKNMYLAGYWQYRYYKADRLPTLSLEATPIDYNRSTQKVYNYDENRDEFKLRQYLNSDVSLKLNQNVPFTGGSIFAQSSLSLSQKLDGDKVSSFSSTPISVGYTQNINGYNALKWQSKLEPLKFEKAKKEYLQSREELSIKGTRLFFDLVDAQIEVRIAETNLSNADTLFEIGKGRYKVGTVTQDELLSLELEHLNSQLALTKAKMGVERAQTQLNSFLSFPEDTKVICLVPLNLPKLTINAPKAVAEALDNNPEILDQKLMLLEQDRTVNQAKSQNGISGNVFALYGLNQNANKFENVYKDPLDRQRLAVGINIPILDWGKRRGKLAMARSNREVVKIGINQKITDFKQNVVMNVMEFNLQAMQVLSSAKADTIAQLGYDVTQQRFLIGKIDVTKLNIARNSQEQAKRAYYRSLRSYWNYYYALRRLTLYNFEKDQKLTEDFGKLITF